jgi:C4-dicarboxylate transporter
MRVARADDQEVVIVGYGVLGRFLQEVFLVVGGLFLVCVCVLFHKVLQDFLEEGGYLGKDSLELCCGDKDEVSLHKIVKDLLN